MIERPEIVEDEHLVFLDELRESAVINMLESRTYLISEYGLEIEDASKIVNYWRRSFEERHNKGE